MLWVKGIIQCYEPIKLSYFKIFLNKILSFFIKKLKKNNQILLVRVTLPLQHCHMIYLLYIRVSPFTREENIANMDLVSCFNI